MMLRKGQIPERRYDDHPFLARMIDFVFLSKLILSCICTSNSTITPLSYAIYLTQDLLGEYMTEHAKH
jgi:hypothetical protein